MGTTMCSALIAVAAWKDSMYLNRSVELSWSGILIPGVSMKLTPEAVLQTRSSVVPIVVALLAAA